VRDGLGNRPGSARLGRRRGGGQVAKRGGAKITEKIKNNMGGSNEEAHKSFSPVLSLVEDLQEGKTGSRVAAKRTKKGRAMEGWA